MFRQAPFFFRKALFQDWFLQESKQLLSLGVPMMITQFFIMGMGFVDAVMAGRYSARDLAGTALGGNAFWPVFMFMIGLTMALTPMVAQLRGAGRVEESGEKIRQGLWIALTCGLFMAGILAAVKPLYQMLDVEQAVIDIATGYMLACATGTVPALVYITLRHSTEGLGHTKPPMLIAGAALLLNIPVNYIFIYGKLGAPELGGVGCGVATAVVFWFELLLMLIVARLPYFRATGLMDRFSLPDMKTILEILRVGLPIGASAFVGMMIFSIIGFLIALIGVSEMAAHTIAGNINWMTYVTPMAIGSAISIRVGFATGARDPVAVLRVQKASLLLILIYALLATGLLVALRHFMVSLYTTDAAVLRIAASLLLFVALYQIFDDLLAGFNGALRGFKDTLAPMLISLISYWFVCLPLGYLLSEGVPGLVQPQGVYGYWAALTFGLFLTCICVGLRLLHTTRKQLQEMSDPLS